METAREQQSGDAIRHRQESYALFLDHLRLSTGMSKDEAERAAVAVLCALEQHLFGDEGRRVEKQLPAKLVALVRRCPLHRGTAPRRFGRKEFFEIVSEDLGPTPRGLEWTARAVLASVREQLSPVEAEAVGAQLGPELAPMWRPAS